MHCIPNDEFLKHYDINKLKELSSFGALNDTFLRLILTHSDIVSAGANELLFKAGNITNEFYIVISGGLRVHRGKVGEDGIANRFGRGESVGFISMLTMQECIGDMDVEEESVLVRIDNHLFARLHEMDGEQFSIFLINLARNMGRAYRRIEDSDTRIKA